MHALRRALALALCATGALAAPAAAAPPPNDDRAAAQEIGLPVSLNGTTVEATREADEPSGGCGATAGSVWYRLTAGADGRIVANLDAAGDLDAIVDVYLRRRSQVSALECDATDADGDASVRFAARRGESYLIRVAQRPGSAADRFRLDVFVPEPEAQPPGVPLPRAGARALLHRTLDPSDAWSVALRAGRTYRVNVSSSRGCLGVSVHGPSASSFDDGAVRHVGCSGYGLFTPERSGRYTILVEAARAVRERQPYHIQVAVAGADDTTPGIFVRNHARVRGFLNAGRIDVVDLYRFDVLRRSDLDLTLASNASFELVLLTDSGRRIGFGGAGSGIRRRLGRGRYFVAVRARQAAAGAYTLRRASRAITSTTLRIAGSRQAQTAPGAAVTIAARVAPRASGPVTVTVERFDPLEGWQFLRRYRLRATGGLAAVRFQPPSVGRYRARASFLGTRDFSPSESGTARLLVAAPLRS